MECEVWIFDGFLHGKFFLVIAFLFFEGTSDAPPPASSVTKPTETSATQRSARAVPKAPTSQPATISSESGAPTTPAKGKFAVSVWYYGDK
jgi:translation initiation factor 4G